MSEHSKRVAGHLRLAAQADRERTRALDAIAQGERVLTPTERQELTAIEREIKALVAQLGNHTTPTSRVVSLEDQGRGAGDKLPSKLIDMYALLVHRAYGSDPAIKIGDPTVIRGLGRATPRTSTNQADGVMRGAPDSAKRPGAARRNTIKDRGAYDLKAKIDRRLRRIGNEVQAFLEGQAYVAKVNVCSRCARYGDDDWRYCPSCGAEMKTEETA